MHLQKFPKSPARAPVNDRLTERFLSAVRELIASGWLRTFCELNAYVLELIAREDGGQHPASFERCTHPINERVRVDLHAPDLDAINSHSDLTIDRSVGDVWSGPAPDVGSEPAFAPVPVREDVVDVIHQHPGWR
ncbi:MAG: hypothetical protein M3Z66_07785 [Chloroflexota bacterium]|nr:hypothetical protein [Chloroflexota bacterium]